MWGDMGSPPAQNLEARLDVLAPAVEPMTPTGARPVGGRSAGRSVHAPRPAL